MPELGRRLCALLVGLGSLVAHARVAHAGDPYVDWYTLTTPHFRVHFHAGIEPIAQKVGTVAEDVYGRVGKELGFQPQTRTELVVTDMTDDANGFAYTLPYPTVQLYASAPDDMSSLGDYDDWVTELVTHELTHILHMGNVSGAGSSVMRSVFFDWKS